jgi:thiosulfate/3-mercaptopyruvate sulfurtransferase
MAHTTLVDCSTLAAHLDDPAWVLFDCRFDLADTGRGRRDYRQSHLPGARYAHLDEDLSSPITPRTGRHPLPDVAQLRAWLGHNGLDHGKQVIVYDDSGGNMAVRLWWLLRWLGHDAVAVLDGGWQAWGAAGLPLTDEPPVPQPARFEGEPDWQQVLSTDQVVADLEHGRWRLIDARTAERFRGEAEPIDTVAGHIPGSVNLPLQQNLGPDGRFRPADELRGLYLEVLGDYSPERSACLCGSGVTACHNLLAMAIAGLPGGRLYSGSWSEWIRDPARPVATGP